MNDDHDDKPAIRNTDRPFNPWRSPATDRSKALIRGVLEVIQAHEERSGLRRRRRRQLDQQRFTATVSALLSDAAYHYLTDQDGGVTVSRSNRVLGQSSRYRPTAIGKTLPSVIDLLSSPELSLLVQRKGRQAMSGSGLQTTILAGPRLIDDLERLEVEADDFGRLASEEVIVLRQEAESGRAAKEAVEYVDTDDTRALRAQVMRLNSGIKTADIAFDWTFQDDPTKTIAVQNRHMRRIFSKGRFDRGGRLFGGFWQQLSKAERRSGITINGEPAVELDFGQIGPRIVYGLKKITAPEGDLYDVPGFERHRDGLKKLMNAMLASPKRLVKFPRGTKQLFARHHRVKDVIAAIEQTHPAIKDMFFTEVVHEVQFIESNIMVEVLLRLAGLGIVALPIHDAVMIPKSKKDTGKTTMLEVLLEHTGQRGSVTDADQQ